MKERKKKKQCMYKPSANAYLLSSWLVGSWGEFKEFYTPLGKIYVNGK